MSSTTTLESGLHTFHPWLPTAHPAEFWSGTSPRRQRISSGETARVTSQRRVSHLLHPHVVVQSRRLGGLMEGLTVGGAYGLPPGACHGVELWGHNDQKEGTIGDKPVMEFVHM